MLKAISVRIIIFCFLSIMSSTSFSADRNEKIQMLMEAQGLLKAFEQRMETTKLQNRQEGQQVFDQMIKEYKPNKESSIRFQAAFEEFITSLEAPWTAQDIVDVWAKTYGVHFSDEELDQLIAFYTSPLGKKETTVSLKSMPELNKHFFELSKPIIERATKNYIEKLRLIAKECKRKK
ncbi:MAG: DUF2059 domain-containing protein [Methylococcaceae bacterium]